MDLTRVLDGWTCMCILLALREIWARRGKAGEGSVSGVLAEEGEVEGSQEWRSNVHMYSTDQKRNKSNKNYTIQSYHRRSLV